MKKISAHIKKKEHRQINIDSDFIRLDSLLKLCNAVMTGGHAKIVIQESEVKQLQTEIIKCNNALESFDQIMEYDDELLIKLLSSFYQIDYYYYDWYTKMELRSLKESDELYKEHTVTTGKAVKTATDLYEGQTTLRENYDKLQKLNNELISFLESIIDFDIEEFEDEHTQSIGLFKKSKKSVIILNWNEG